MKDVDRTLNYIYVGMIFGIIILVFGIKAMNGILEEHKEVLQQLRPTPEQQQRK